MGGPGYWLWCHHDHGDSLPDDSSRGRKVVTETLGSEFDGVLVSDCLASYENVPYRTHKCIAHHLKAIAEARDQPDTPDPTCGQTRAVLRTVIGIWRAAMRWTCRSSRLQHGSLEKWLDRLLAAERTQPGDVAIRKRIEKRVAVRS